MSAANTNANEYMASLAIASTTKETSQSEFSSGQVKTAFTKGLFGLWKLTLLCILNSFTGFAFGWDVGTAGGITNFDSFKRRFGGDSGNIDSIVIGVIIAVFNLGCALGGIGLSKIADKLGRRMTIFIGLAIYAVGTIVQITSVTHNHWGQILAGRVITGLSIGLFSVVTPMMVSECSPSTVRGELVVFFQLFITFGIFMGSVTNLACKSRYAGEDTEWMVPIGLNFAWILIIAIGNLFMYESPSYLLAKNRDEESAQITRKIHGITDNPTSTEIAYVEDLITQRKTQRDCSLKAASNQPVQWTEIFTGEPKYGLRLVIGMSIMMFQQLSGANYFFYYGTTLFRSVGLKDSYQTAMILGAVNFLSTFGGIYAVDRFGRKTCLLAGSAGMGICMLIYSCLGSFALEKNGVTNPSVGATMIAFTCIYIFFFATTWGPVAFVVVSELFPIKTRAMAMACSVAMNWLANFLISLLTPTIINAIGFKYGFIFSGCLIVSFIFVWFLLKETKDCKTDEDVNRKYSVSKNASDLEGTLESSSGSALTSLGPTVERLQEGGPDAKVADSHMG